MDAKASGNEETCGISPSQQPNQQRPEHFSVSIKQEVEDDDCSQNPDHFSNITKDHCEHFAVLSMKAEGNDAQGGQSTFTESKLKDDVSRELFTSVLNPVKAEEDGVFSKPGLMTLPTEVKQEEQCKVEVEHTELPGYDEPCKLAQPPKPNTSDTDDHENDPLTRHAKRHCKDSKTAATPNTEATGREVPTKTKSYSTTHVTIKRKSGVQIHHCTKCRYTTRRKESLQTHINAHHDQHAALYRCQHCDFSSRYEKSLTRHWQYQHDPHVRLYRCSKCAYTTKYKKNLSDHVGRHAVRERNLDGPARLQPAQSADFSPQRRQHVEVALPAGEVYRCPRCDFATNVHGRFVEHFRSTHNAGATLRKCPACGYTTRYEDIFVQHLRVQHDLDAEGHERSADGEAGAGRGLQGEREKGPVAYRCVGCPYACKRRDLLNLHVKIKHSREAEVFQCPCCDYAPHYKSSLTRHLRLHHDADDTAGLYGLGQKYRTSL